MADPTLIVLAALGIGIAGGITSSVIGFITTIANGTAPIFNKAKFAIAVMTGAIAGLTIGMAQASSPVFSSGTSQDIIIALGTIFLGAVGVDFIRNRIGDAQSIAAKKP